MWLKSCVLSLVMLVLCGCEAKPTPVRPPRPTPVPPPAQIRVLAFTATWCGPCQRQKPLLVAVRAAGVQVRVIDIDEQPEMAREYNVTEVPTFIVFVQGQKPFRTHDANDILVLVRTRHR